MQLEFVGQSSQDPDNRPANPSRLVNCYRERVGGRSEYVIKSCLGTALTASLGSVIMRTMANIGGTLYAVHGGALRIVHASGQTENLGSVALGDSSISGNNGKVTVAAGGKYYVFDGNSLTQPSGGAFRNFGSVTFFGQYTVLTEAGGRRVQWSNLADPNTLDALNFATAEQRDDAIIRALPVGGELWIFKEASTERWYQDGVGLAYIPGSAQDIGLKEFDLIAPIQNGVFFVGSDGKAYIAAGGAMQPVSTVPVETSIQSQKPQRAFYYQDEGHEFCVITFADRPAWVFDLSLGEWHERGDASGEGAWPIKACVGAYGAFYAGDDMGRVYKLTRNNTDNGVPMVRRMVSRTFQNEGRRFKVNKLQFQGRVGWGSVDDTLDQSPDALEVGYDALAADTGALKVADITPRRDPQVMLRVSGDHGQSFGNVKTRSIGQLGEYDTQIVWRALGQFRAFTVELSCSEPLDVPFDATAFMEVS